MNEVNRASRSDFRYWRADECSEASPTTSSYGIASKALADTFYQNPGSQATFGGISQRKVCQIRCSIGTVRGCLVDGEGNRTRLYDFPAFLAKTNRIPLIIGFAQLLEKSFEYEADEAWVEER